MLMCAISVREDGSQTIELIQVTGPNNQLHLALNVSL